MKISLDTSEVAAILTNWGKEKYKTHNVSVSLPSKIIAELEITMSEQDFGEGGQSIVNETMNRLIKAHKSQPIGEEPDLTPIFDPSFT